MTFSCGGIGAGRSSISSGARDPFCASVATSRASNCNVSIVACARAVKMTAFYDHAGKFVVGGAARQVACINSAAEPSDLND